MAVDMTKFVDGNGLLYGLKGLKAQIVTLLSGKVDKVSGKGLSTNDYTTDEKNKLAGLKNYTHPTTAGNKHIPAGGKAGQVLGYSADGTAQWVDDKDTTYSDATQSAHGLMTADDKKKLDGVATGANKYVHPSYTAAASGLYKVTVDASGHVSATTAVAKSDITALGIPSTNTTYSAATQSASGLMSADDKKKLDAFGAAGTYATQTYVGQQIAAAGHITKTIVTALPAVADAKDNVIYMIKKASGTSGNLYDEYMLIDGALEKVGDTETKISTLSNADVEEILGQI